MNQVNIAQAKAHFSELIQKVLLGEEVIIAKDHQPIVRMVPLNPPQGKRRPGSGTGELLHMDEDFDAPLEDFREYMT